MLHDAGLVHAEEDDLVLYFIALVDIACNRVSNFIGVCIEPETSGDFVPELLLYLLGVGGVEPETFYLEAVI